MRNLQYKLKSAKFAGTKELLILELHGFISASTFVTFERLLDDLVNKPDTKYVLLDFHDVNYINSSGIGALVAQADTLGKRGGALALARVHRNVGQTMQILGLTTLMHFLTDSKEALSYFESIAAAGAKPPAKAPGKAKFIETPPSGVAVLAAKLREKGPSKRGVLVVAPAKGPFTDTVKLWVSKEGANFSIVHDCIEALALLEKTKPDLVILEDSVPGSDDFVAKVKLAGDTTLISIIKLYSKSTEPSRRRDFKIWENDFLIEPFEVKELFALSEVELSRAPMDRAAMLNQLHFTFKCSEDNVNKAKELGRNAIFKVGLDQDNATAFFAAYQEAVDNAVRHGNRYDIRKRIDVVFTIAKDKITTEVDDEGKGFNFNHYLFLAKEQDTVTRARASRAEGRIGGLGIKLMQQCCDHVEYLGKGTKLRIEKNIPATPAPAPAKPTCS